MNLFFILCFDSHDVIAVEIFSCRSLKSTVKIEGKFLKYSYNINIRNIMKMFEDSTAQNYIHKLTTVAWVEKSI